MKKRRLCPELQALRETLNGGPPDRKDKRWSRECSYCWLYLRKHYSYDHAHKHRFCPTCNANRQKEGKKVDGDLKPEVCPQKIGRPKPREQGKLGRVVVSGIQPRPLEDAKWSTLKDWAERMRDRHERKGQFLTVGGLVNLVYRTLPYDRASKAANRLKDLYRKEWQQWELGVKRDIEDALRRERVAEEKRQRLLEQKRKPQSDGLSRKEQRVLDVIGRFGMDKAEIRTESGLSKVSKPLRRLVQLGLVVCRNGQYLLPRKEKPKKRGGKSRR